MQNTYAQERGNALFKNTQFIRTDSGLIINSLYSYECKNYKVKSCFIPGHTTVMTVPVTAVAKETKPAFITVHGNISYNFFYRSEIDTPFAESNVMQHQVQTRHVRVGNLFASLAGLCRLDRSCGQCLCHHVLPRGNAGVTQAACLDVSIIV